MCQIGFRVPVLGVDMLIATPTLHDEAHILTPRGSPFHGPREEGESDFLNRLWPEQLARRESWQEIKQYVGSLGP